MHSGIQEQELLRLTRPNLSPNPWPRLSQEVHPRHEQVRQEGSGVLEQRQMPHAVITGHDRVQSINALGSVIEPSNIIHGRSTRDQVKGQGE